MARDSFDRGRATFGEPMRRQGGSSKRGWRGMSLDIPKQSKAGSAQAKQGGECKRSVQPGTRRSDFDGSDPPKVGLAEGQASGGLLVKEVRDFMPAWAESATPCQPLPSRSRERER